ncbi:MAG: 50S ribosomal protein L9 [Parachlamydiales bacterium]|nr:50S ribosomal protein L9 [Parachlamydiales bacterium]
MKQNLLLIEDVADLGRSGDIVEVKAGYARNFLLPKKKGVLADKNTLRMREKLVIERAKRAEIDKKEAEELAEKLKKIALEIIVKVDPEGKMYGSVSAAEIVHLLEKEGIVLEKRAVLLKHPIKETGVVEVPLRLPEGVMASVVVKILAEVVGEIKIP